MYYLIPDKDNKALITSEQPEEGTQYLAVEELPPRPSDRKDYYLQLFVDVEEEKVWWDWVSISSGTLPVPSVLDERVEDLEGALDILLEGLT